MNIKRLTLGELGTNCYIVSDDEGNAVVVDPADDAETISDYLIENDLSAKAILLTHGHYDHILGSAGLRKLTGAVVVANEMEKETLMSSHLNAGDRMGHTFTVTPDRLVTDGEVFSYGELTFKVIYTPGHTIGSTCYYNEQNGVMFTGDTIFYGSAGRTDLPTGNEELLYESLGKLKSLPDDTQILPGHGRTTTLEGEKKRNPFLQ